MGELCIIMHVTLRMSIGGEKMYINYSCLL